MAAKKEIEMVTTTIRLPKDLYRKLQHLALDEDATVRSVIQKVLAEYVSRKGKKGGSI